MAVYDYLCPNCRNIFESIRPLSDADQPIRCPKCGSDARRMVSGLGVNVGDLAEPAGEPAGQPRADSGIRSAASLDAAVTSSPPSASDGSARRSERGREAPRSLLQMLEELANRVRSLEREKRQADAMIQALEREKRQASITIQALEREVGELGALIAQVSERVDRMLRESAIDDKPQSRPASTSPRAIEDTTLPKPSGDAQNDPKDRYGQAFRLE